MSSNKKFIEKLYLECINTDDGPFAGSTSSLFSLTANMGAKLPFEEQKEAFLNLLERLLREKKVLLSTPPVRDDIEPGYWVICDGYSDHKPKRKMERTDESEPNRMWVWDVPIEQQIDYIRSAFPKNVTNENDSELNDFWYLGECPGIAWIHPETRVLYAS